MGRRALLWLILRFFSAAKAEACGVMTYGRFRNARAGDHSARGARRVWCEEAADRGLRSRTCGARIQEGDERGRGGTERPTKADPFRGHGRGIPGGRQED